MLEIAICEETVKAVKKALGGATPGARSAHLHEALARGLGFKTYAALRVAMRSITQAEHRFFDPETFKARLAEMSHEPPQVAAKHLEDAIRTMDIIGVVASVR